MFPIRLFVSFGNVTMEQFTFFVNFKTYPQATGEEAVALAKICFKMGRQTGQTIIPVVQAADLFRIKKETDGLLWTQHVDYFEAGAHTGWLSPEAILAAGASGTLLGHSEHQLPPGTVKQVLARVKSSKSCLPAGRCKVQSFETMVAAKTLGQLEKLAKLKPDYLAYEIAELIAGKVSIAQANPKAIAKAVKIAGETPLIVGAGVNKAEDLAVACNLGAKGVLVANAIMSTKDPKVALLELLRLV